MSEKTHYDVNFHWRNVEPDNAQYKPFKPLFEPDNVFITISVPAEYVLDAQKDYIRLSVAGLQYCRQQLLGKDGPVDNDTVDNTEEWAAEEQAIEDEFGDDGSDDW